MDREQAGLNQLRFILAQELDRLSERREADLQGQLTFPFMQSEPTDGAHHSGNADERAAFARTGSQQSW
jgi:hypothetical protein